MNRVKHTASFRINQPVDVLFPLFSAEGEKLWVPGWDYRNIMGTTELHEDYVFLKANPVPGEADSIWLVKRHDLIAHHVEFYKVEAGTKVGIIAVQCDALTPASTEVSVSYEYIALGDKGDEFIAGFTRDLYEEYIAGWKRLLETYFTDVSNDR